MAYARYGRDCGWYIFWHATMAGVEDACRRHRRNNHEEVLAIWHSDHRVVGPLFNYSEVSEMLRSLDFSRIPGYTDRDRALIRECLTEFVNDVDRDRVGDES
jgi:hypothetical protein